MPHDLDAQRGESETMVETSPGAKERTGKGRLSNPPGDSRDTSPRKATPSVLQVFPVNGPHLACEDGLGLH